MSILESKIEEKVVSYAWTRYGCLHLKLNVQGRIGWPDHLFLYKGRVLFVEFKREGELPRKAQEEVHERIRRNGGIVSVVDNIIDGKRAIDKFAAGSSHL